MFKKRVLKIISLMMIGLLIICVCHSAIDIWLFSSKTEFVQTDAAIVLGAAVCGNKPSPVFKERINHSIWLYKKGWVKKIIFTGGKGDVNELAESEVAKRYAMENNIIQEDVFIETESKITEENLEYAYEIGNENGLNTFTIVSDPLHMKRSMVIAKDLGMQAYSSPTPTSAYKTLKTKVPFFCREVFFYTGYLVSLMFR